MIVRLLWKFLPYLLVVGCLLMLAVAIGVLVKGPETQPTAVDLATLTPKSPDKDWLTVTGGGLWLPDVIVETKKGKRDKEPKPARYYVPLVTEAEAIRRAADAGDVTRRPATTVFVKFSVSAFQSRYPAFANVDTIGNVKPDDVFREGEVRGTRSKLSMLGGKLKTYVTDELRLDPASVTIIDFEDRPMQASEAMGLGVASILVGLGSAFWGVRRWTARPTMA